VSFLIHCIRTKFFEQSKNLSGFAFLKLSFDQNSDCHKFSSLLLCLLLGFTFRKFLLPLRYPNHLNAELYMKVLCAGRFVVAGHDRYLKTAF